MSGLSFVVIESLGPPLPGAAVHFQSPVFADEVESVTFCKAVLGIDMA